MKYFIALVFAFSTLLSLAQKREFASADKALKDDFGVTLQMNGFLNALNLTPTQDLSGNDVLAMRYFWREHLAFRLGFGLDGFRNNLTRVDSVGNSQVEFDSTSTQFNFFLNPGFERHFTKYKRIDPYFGAGFNLGFLGANKQKSTQLTTDTTGTARREYDGNFPGGFLFGIYSTFGFNYFIAPKLALGAEYSFGFYNSRKGGDYSTTIIDTPISGQPIVSRTVGSNFSNELGINFNNSALITLSYFFSN